MILRHLNTREIGTILAGRTPLGAFATINHTDEKESTVVPKAVIDLRRPVRDNRHERPSGY